MSFINTEALARCLDINGGLQPFRRLLCLAKTVKTVSVVGRIFHPAKASVLMKSNAVSYSRGFCGLGSRCRVPHLVIPSEVEESRGKALRQFNGILRLLPPLRDPLRMTARKSASGLQVTSWRSVIRSSLEPGCCFLVLLLAACRPDMANQPKAKPLSESDFFSNQSNARPIPPHTVEHGGALENTAFYTGLTNGSYITQLPVKLTPEVLARGRERFDAMCAECHDRTGSGNGMVVQRGFPQPPSYDAPRLRNAAIGHFVDVIANGYGVMYSYATRVEPEDRWAIAAYIRALQLSHNIQASQLTPDEQRKLENEK